MTGYRAVDLVAVVSARKSPPASVVELAGRRVVAARPVAELISQLPLEPAIDAVVPHPGADAPAALVEVARGGAEIAVVDTDTAQLELANRPDLRSAVVVLPDVQLAWLVNPSARGLVRRVERFLDTERRSGLIRQLVLSDLGSWRPYVSPRLPEVPAGDLTPYDEVLKWVGQRYEIDWRLLASLMYEESRFDPWAVGPGGSAGLFQFMPFTWR